LRNVFCLDESRTVANDWTVSYRAQVIQILKRNAPLPKPGDKILVRTWLDGQVHFLFRDHPLHVQFLEKRPPKPMGKPSPVPARVTKYKPAANHPWRRARVPTPA
jgi:hypothetical protein